jgi:hypothetical protein
MPSSGLESRSPTASPLAGAGVPPPRSGGSASGSSSAPGGEAGGAGSTGQLVVPLPSSTADDGEVIAGLDATVRSALLDIGLVGWTVPALALSVPGILVVIVVALQLIGGVAWLPVARRTLSRTTTPGPAARARRSRDPHRSGR